MNYAFLIRNDRCIGCHACSTACKSENQVPVGVNRTWVKTVERGSFPDVRRHFQVTRCNHCAEPPCVEICPTRAMYRRDDGIVEFDPDRCIGCKACLQGCPYDAIHIDPESGTAAKCHFCAHRVELDMEPPCVVVCPEHAIIAGDLEDPDSEISRMLAAHQVTVRRPERGTRPRLFYVDGEEAGLHPSLAERDPTGYATTERRPPPREGHADPSGAGSGPGRAGGTGSERARESGRGPDPSGPIQVQRGRMAGGLTQTFYDVDHPAPWHWPVPAYLVTKGIAAGLFLLMAAGHLSGMVPPSTEAFLVLGLGVLLFLGATTGLLVADLERPERFLWVLRKGRPGSWLVRGAWILIAFSAVVGLWWLAEAAAWLGMGSVAASGPGTAPTPGAATSAPEWLAGLRIWTFVLGTPLAVLAAVYTAFLFGQARGRELWQSPLLPFHLLAQALVAGSALVLLVHPFAPLPPTLVSMAWWTFVAVLALDLLILLPGEFAMPHSGADARAAARSIVRGRYRRQFWAGAVVLGHVVPLLLLGAVSLAAVLGLSPEQATAALASPPWVAVAGGMAAGAVAGVLALVGLYLYEHAWVMAPQDLPNS